MKPKNRKETFWRKTHGHGHRYEVNTEKRNYDHKLEPFGEEISILIISFSVHEATVGCVCRLTGVMMATGEGLASAVVEQDC